VRLNWTDNGNNETRFEVQRQQTPSGPSIENFSTVATLAANATTMTDAGLTPGSGYQYRVLAANAAGASAFSNIVAVTTAVTSPAAPSGLAASYNTTSRTYTLTWVDNSDNEDGFQVQAAYAGGAFADIAYVGVNATTHTSMPNPSIGSYQFRVRSFRPSLPSAYSSTAVLVVANPTPTTSILWIQPAESTFGMPGTLTAAGFAAGGSGAVQLVWRERSGAGVWGPWTTVSYQAPVQADTTWANTISSGSYTNQCHWFDAYTNYAGATSPVFHYTGVPGCS
jgi:titin